MKTILSRLKTLVSNKRSDGTIAYVKDVEIVHPELGETVITIPTLPKILIVPVSTSEQWTASQEKEAIHRVDAYLLMRYLSREQSIIGNPSVGDLQGKGIIDFAQDFMGIIRGHRLAVDGENYLTAPSDIQSVDYIVDELGSNGFLLVAHVILECRRVFLQTSLPGNI